MDRLSKCLRALVEDDTGSDFNEYDTKYKKVSVDRVQWDREEGEWMADIRGYDLQDAIEGPLEWWPIPEKTLIDRLEHEDLTEKQIKKMIKARKPIEVDLDFQVEYQVLKKRYAGREPMPDWERRELYGR